MPEMVYQAARRFAKTLLDEYWDGETLPVPLGGIARRYQVQVLYDDTLAISGMVAKPANGIPTVIINDSEPIQRQRFTLAHELGHIVERAEAGDEEYSFMELEFGTLKRSNDYNLLEFLADEFAGALLMPVEAIEQLQQQELTPRQIANKFGVSLAAYNKRLERLNKQPETTSYYVE